MLNDWPINNTFGTERLCQETGLLKFALKINVPEGATALVRVNRVKQMNHVD
jgi:hypothetical protein